MNTEGSAPRITLPSVVTAHTLDMKGPSAINVSSRQQSVSCVSSKYYINNEIPQIKFTINLKVERFTKNILFYFLKQIKQKHLTI